MKKLSLFLYVAMFMIMSQTPSFAAEVTLTDAANGVLEITGDANKGEKVTLIILNPGSSLEDAYTAADDNVQYFRSCVSDDAGYKFTVEMNTQTGGKYGMYITVGDVQTGPEYFDYYSKSVKEDIITRINNSSSVSSSLLEDAMTAYSLKDSLLYKNCNASEAAKLLTSIKSNQKGGIFLPDIVDFYSKLRQALVLAAYNESADGVIDKSGFVLYSDVLGIDGTDAYDDYLNALSESGRNKMNSELLGGGYASVDDFRKSFEEKLAYYVIMYYKQYGYGHVQTNLIKYSSVYKSNGFKLSEPSLNSVYSQMVNSGAGNLKSLAAVYNDLKSNTGTTGGGSGSGGGGSSAPNIKVNNTSAPDNIYYESDKLTVFNDVKKDHWAAEYILNLYNKGIISGYEDGSFRPEGNVTRGEFAKMVCSVLGITNKASAVFTDVSQHWSNPYVAAAYENGIITGMTDELFAPDSAITREQGAAVLYRALKLGSTNAADKFADDDSISGYAVEAVYALRRKGIISGRENNKFEPKTTLTRAEAAKMICSIISNRGEQ
ncbi:MAG: S-layer homology domain-containing protein [Clostridia bacterium]|nr:S-layer homology domain-containing protein [Clostridia bacterium]